MSTRQILVSVWQNKPLKVKDFLSLLEKFDFEIVVDTLRALDEKAITVNDAEEMLQERRKRWARH